MENYKTNKNHSSKISHQLNDEKDNFQLKYIFYWQLYSDPLNINQIEAWEKYDQINQKYLNLKYEEYSQDSNKSIFHLLSPRNNYFVNFLKMQQFNHIDNEEIRLIKKENLNQLSITQQHYSNDEEEFQFFIEANENNRNININFQWTPYEAEDQFILKDAYKKYLQDKFKSIVELKKPSDYFIDFFKMLQIHKTDSNKNRAIQRFHPKLVSNIVRKNRFCTFNNDFKIKPNILRQQILNGWGFLCFLLESDNNKFININKIFFKIFNEFPCEIEIEEDLCFFEDRTSIQLSLQEIKQVITKEVLNLSQLNGHNNNSADFYRSEIEKIADCASFFNKILYIYTIEGYLYRQINMLLQILDKSKLENIKYFYTSLLASFQYFSKKTKFNCNQDLIVYRVSEFSDEEAESYNKQNNKNIYRIFNEFLSTSFDKKISVNYFHKDDSNTKEYLWEITIPKDIVKNEPHNFADISNTSIYPHEKEILIRSGAIIQINHIIPYTEVINNQEIIFPNKFKKICTLKSFSLACFLKLISFDPSVN